MGTSVSEALSLSEVEGFVHEMQWALSYLNKVTDPEYGSDWDRCATIAEVMGVLTEHPAFKSAMAVVSKRPAN